MFRLQFKSVIYFFKETLSLYVRHDVCWSILMPGEITYEYDVTITFAVRSGSVYDQP